MKRKTKIFDILIVLALFTGLIIVIPKSNKPENIEKTKTKSAIFFYDKQNNIKDSVKTKNDEDLSWFISEY